MAPEQLKLGALGLDARPTRGGVGAGAAGHTHSPCRRWFLALATTVGHCKVKL